MATTFLARWRGKIGATKVVAEQFVIDSTVTKTATASSGAATLNTNSGVITSEALTTAAAASYTLTLTDSQIAAIDQVLVTVASGTNTQGIPVVSTVKPASGSVVIVVANLHASQALNGTLKVAFAVLKNA